VLSDALRSMDRAVKPEGDLDEQVPIKERPWR
jgi:hypothetical protein